MSFFWLENQLWLGFTTQFSKSESTGITVEQVFKKGPAAHLLKPGDVIDGVLHEGEILVLPSNIRMDPNMLPGFHQYNEFVAYNQALYEIAKSGSVKVQVDGERIVEITPLDKRPLYAVEPIIYVAIVLGVLATAIGVVCYLRKPDEIVTVMLLVLGFTVGCFLFSEALLDRELFVSGEKLRAASILRVTFGTLYPFATVAVFFIWPTRMLTIKSIWMFFLISVGIVFTSASQIVGIPLHDMMGHIPIYYLLLMSLFALQWRRSKGDPIHRASLMMMFLFTVLPVSFSVLLGNVPMLYGVNVAMDDRWLWLLNAPLIVFGWGLAVYQYRLFDVERWWFKSLLWLFGGISVVLFDALFVLWLGLSGLQALPLALFVAGFMYFPLRQWLYSNRLRVSERKLVEVLPEFVSDFASIKDDHHYASELLSILRRVFHPSSAGTFCCEEKHEGVAIEDNGLAVRVVAMDGHCLRLYGKNDGSSLFGREDVEFIDSLRQIGELSNKARKVREQSIKEERNRIMSDLHDSLGAKLLTMKHRLAPRQEESEMAGDALDLLRDTVKYSVYEDNLSLEELLSELRAEVRERLGFASVTLDWVEESTDKRAGERGMRLSSLNNLLVAHTLREGISNAIKYSSEPEVKVRIKVSVDVMSVQIKNPIEQSGHSRKSSSGLRGLDARARKIGAQIQSSEIRDDQGRRWYVLYLELNTSDVSPAVESESQYE